MTSINGIRRIVFLLRIIVPPNRALHAQAAPTPVDFRPFSDAGFRIVKEPLIYRVVSGVRHPAGVTANVPGTANAESDRSSAWPYVIVGGVVGGLVSTVWLVYEVNSGHNEFIGSPVIFVIPIAGAIALGGLAGWLVHGVVHSGSP